MFELPEFGDLICNFVALGRRVSTVLMVNFMIANIHWKLFL